MQNGKKIISSEMHGIDVKRLNKLDVNPSPPKLSS